jgi:hypothetical protein
MTPAYFLVTAALVVTYTLRDSFLLGLVKPRRLGRVLHLHALSSTAAVLPAFIATRELTPGDLIEWLHAPAVWVPVLGIHTALTVYAWSLGHSRTPARAWRLALIPAPINVIALVASVRFFVPHATVPAALIQGALAAVIWTLTVRATTRWNLSFQAAKDDPEFAISLATVSNLAGLIAAPLGAIPALWP